MQERGLYKLTVNEIASAAGLSKRTIYRHFASKDEIIEATIASIMEGIGQQFTIILDSNLDTEEIFPQLFQQLFQLKSC
jgi:AcrR family transcriptional regulator